MRRTAIAYFSEGEVLQAMSGSTEQEFCVLTAVELPEDAKVLSVHHDFSRNAFAFVIESQSFSEVPDYLQSPELTLTRRIVQRPRFTQEKAA